MSTTKFVVPGVSCQHCVSAVNKELKTVDGVQQVHVDLTTKVVTVEHADQVAPAALVAAIQEAGYEEVSPAA
jgi:copper chaperone